MSVLSNRHMLIAALVAPVLAVLAYFGIGAIVGETPHVAEAGQSYQLVEKPNCRYSSGNCGLKNNDFELSLKVEWLDDIRVQLILKSVFPLDGVKVAVVENKADEKPPVDMRPLSNDGLSWSLDMALPDPENNRLHLVASSGSSFYFGDVATKFTLKEKF